MSKYVDGYVLPVPKDKLDKYTKMAQDGGNLWVKCGALYYFECLGDDLTPEMGGMKVRQFPELLNLADDEVVIFAFVVYESREHRDEVNAKVMEGMDDKYKDCEMPFDASKMVYGGFKSIVSIEQ